MENYIGCKIIKATPMGEHEFTIKYKNRPDLIDGPDRPGYCIKYPDGYISWSPSHVFETAYRIVTDDEISLILNGD